MKYNLIIFNYPVSILFRINAYLCTENQDLSSMNISRRLNEETIWLLFLCLAAFFINNSSLPTDIMETRNIVTAREIVADGNWLVPTMNGVLRIEKPPLPTWIAAVVETLNPRDLSTQRSAAGLAAAMWTMFLYFVGS